MPYINPKEEHIAAAVAKGYKPEMLADYLYDTDNNKLIRKDKAPSLTGGEQAMEFGKGIGAGALEIVRGIPRTIGNVADAVRQKTGTYDPADPSEFTKAADWIGEKTEEYLPQDPRGWVAGGVGRGVGQLLDAASAAGLSRKVLSKSLSKLPAAALNAGATRAAVGTGMLTTSGNVVERELARQEREKMAADPALAAVKGLGVGAATGPIEYLGGIGALGRLISQGGQSWKSALMRQGMLGAGTEAVEQGIEDLVVEGKTSAESLGKSALIGGLVQGGVGGAIAGVQGEGGTKTEVKPEVKTDPEVAAPTLPKIEALSDAEIIHMLDRTSAKGSTWPPAKAEDALDFDVGFEKGRKDGSINSINDVRELLERTNAGEDYNAVLDDFVRRPTGTAIDKAEGKLPIIDRMADDDIQLILDLDPEANLPKPTAVQSAIIEGRSKEAVNSIADARRLEEVYIAAGGDTAKGKAAMDAEVNRLYMEKQKMAAPKKAAEAAKAMEEKNYAFLTEVFPVEMKKLEGREKTLDDNLKLIEDTAKKAQKGEALASELRRAAAVKAATDATKAAINADRDALFQQYINSLRQPDPATSEIVIADRRGQSLGGQPPEYTGPTEPEFETDPSNIIDVEVAGETVGNQGNLLEGPADWQEGQALRQAMDQVRPSVPPPRQPPGSIREAMDQLRMESLGVQPEAPAQPTRFPGGKTEFGMMEDMASLLEMTRGMEDPANTAPPVQQEDEQGRPFGGEPYVRYSGVPSEILQSIGKAFGHAVDFPLGAMNYVTRSSRAELAVSNPAGAYIAGLMPTLWQERAALEAKWIGPLQEHSKVIRDPVFRQWLMDSIGTGKDNISALPAEMQAAGKAYRNAEKQSHKDQVAAKVWVTDAATGKKRPPQDDPAYAMLGVGKEVRDAYGSKSPEVAQLDKDWFNNWKKYDSKRGWYDRALAKKDAVLQGPVINVTSTTPTFAAVRESQGIPLPPSWRAKDAYDGITSHLKAMADDIVWAKVMEHDATARRILGYKADPTGVSTDRTDPVKWSDVSAEDWKLAVREGKRAGAKWAQEADENVPSTGRIADDILVDSKDLFGPKPKTAIESLMRSYTLDSKGGNLTAAAGAANQLAAGMLMQTESAIRDVGSSIINTYKHAGVWPTIKGVVDGVMQPLVKMELARQAGGLPLDTMAVEMTTDTPEINTRNETVNNVANAVIRGLLKAPRAIRKATGRHQADAWGRALIYNTLNEVMASGNGTGLLEAYGPKGWENMPLDEAASKTAAILAERDSNTSTANNLPAWAVPQMGHPAGILFRLSNWGTGQFNTFMEDVVRPMKNGEQIGFDRMVRLALGGTLAGTAVASFINMLRDRKPEHLTWAEWMKLPNDEQKLKELFYTLTGYNQAMGTAAGILNDYVMLPVSRAVAGGDFDSNIGGDLNPQLPAWIVAKQWINTTESFWKAASSGYLRPEDIADYGLEMLKVNQLAKPLLRIGGELNPNAMDLSIGEQKIGREERVFKRMTGLNPVTGDKQLTARGMRQPFNKDPFSYNTRVKAAGLDDEGEWAKLEALAEEAKAGKKPVRLPGGDLSIEFFQDVEKRMGREYAEEIAREVLRGEEDTKKRNQILKVLERRGKQAKE